MQQLDVQADEEALEPEVEVERLLQKQEVEAEKQVAHVERLFQPSRESVPLESAQENRKYLEQVASPKVDEQHENSNSIPLLPPDHPNQEVKTTVNDISAALTT